MSDMSPVPETTKVVLPTAPERRVTLNKGMVSTSWYDIKTLDRTNNNSDLYNRQQVQDSSEILERVMQDEINLL